MPAPDVSVVVVNYRTEALSARALVDAARSAAPYRAELVVVDNGATEASLATLRAAAPDATVVPLSENRGFAAGVNAGVRAARAPMLFVVNSDAFARGDALARLLRHAADHPRAGLVAPRLSNADGSLQINAYKRFPSLFTLFVEFCLPLHPLHGTRLHPHALPRSAMEAPGRVAHVMGAAMLIRRAAYDAAGPLDEGFFLYLEETEWQRRLTQAGWEVRFEPAAVVEHLEHASDDVDVVSRHYLVSAQRYHHPAWAARLVMRAGAVVSLAAAAVAQRVRPADPRFPRLVSAYRDVLRWLGGAGAAPR
jgi:N-acetylglucosaminyl-diphospho-decaprenol L-rhamnosyltransferase